MNERIVDRDRSRNDVGEIHGYGVRRRSVDRECVSGIRIVRGKWRFWRKIARDVDRQGRRGLVGAVRSNVSESVRGDLAVGQSSRVGVVAVEYVAVGAIRL